MLENYSYLAMIFLYEKSDFEVLKSKIDGLQNSKMAAFKICKFNDRNWFEILRTWIFESHLKPHRMKP